MMEWLGKYESFVEKLVQFSNVCSQIAGKQVYFGGAARFTPVQIQILEYLLKNGQEHRKMADIAAVLGISPSALSKNVAQLLESGVVEKYHRNDNRKDIILLPTEKGKAAYEEYVTDIFQFEFQKVFQMLEEIPLAELEKLGAVLDYMSARQLDRIRLYSKKETEPHTLVKIE